jgi:hypothetical protein
MANYNSVLIASSRIMLKFRGLLLEMSMLYRPGLFASGESILPPLR